MRTRVRKKEATMPFARLKAFFATILLHLSFYAFIITVVVFFIEYFSV
ncbi:hypothetical protein [Mesobacillus zeae]|nr:hypothetical protein [Mesobacillus zeae]